MPKLKKEQTPEEIFGRWVRALVSVSGGADALSATLGCAKSTVYNRMHNPFSFTVRELRAIRTMCGMSREDFVALLSRCL